MRRDQFAAERRLHSREEKGETLIPVTPEVFWFFFDKPSVVCGYDLDFDVLYTKAVEPIFSCAFLLTHLCTLTRQRTDPS